MKEYKEQIYDFYKEAVSKITKGYTLESLANLAYETFQIPLIIVDVGYNLLANGNGGLPYKDPYWNTITEKGGPTDGTIVNFYLKEGFLDRISSCDGAIYTNWGICTDYPQTSGPIYINGNLEGFVSILFMDEALLDFSLELNTIICQLSAIIMSTSNMSLTNTHNPVLEVLAQKMLDTDNFPETPNIDVYKPYVNIVPKYVILVIAEEYGETAKLKHVRGRIKNIYPDIIYLHKSGKLYLFLYNINETMYLNYLTRLTDYLEKYNLLCGISDFFDDLSDRKTFIEQAESALYTVSSLSDGKRAINFSENYTDIVLCNAKKELCKKNVIPKAIKLLAKSDDEIGTEYISTLDAYLYMRNDLVKAASILHLHRNTLAYRLTKIADITGVNINDPAASFELQIGIRLLKMM